MTAATITAVLEASAALVVAVTGLVAAFRGSQQLKSHVAACSGTATPAASPAQKGSTGG